MFENVIENIFRRRASSALLLLVWLTFFAVRETEFVLVTQFGQPLYTVTDAGLHVKWPFQTAELLRSPAAHLQSAALGVPDARQEEPGDRELRGVADPGSEALRRNRGRSGGAPRCGCTTSSGRAFRRRSARTISKPIVSANLQTVKAGEMLDQLSALTDRAALEQYGIEVVDVRIKRLNLPEQNKQSVYARMRAERERIARQYRAEGEEQALSIRADADRQKEEILSVAYKEAEKVKGEGDAESTRIYSQAYSRNPRFYKLLRTLESYKKMFDDKTTAILSSDSELLKVLMHGEGGVK